MKPESKVQTEIKNYIKSLGGYCIKVIKGNESGIPDLIACIDGLFIGIEVKAERFEKNPLKEASEWQKKHLRMITDANGISMCVASLQQFIDTYEEWYLS